MRVGVDGVDGAGKTVFADELATVLQAADIAVVRGSVDGFHRPAAVRYRRGRGSPQGFYRDSYDYDAFEQLLLEPLGPAGSRRFVRAVYDVETETPIAPIPETAPASGVAIVDGIFLHRPRLRRHWDYSVFLDVDFAVSIPRGAGRGYGDPNPAAPANRRYIGGQRLYLHACAPHRQANVVIDNNDLAHPVIVARNGDRPRREL